MFYVRAKDEPYLVYSDDYISYETTIQLKTLKGTTIRLPKVLFQEKRGRDGLSLISYALADESTGRFVYFADSTDNLLYKIELATGRVLAVRKLPFTPTALAIDDERKKIYSINGQRTLLITMAWF